MHAFPISSQGDAERSPFAWRCGAQRLGVLAHVMKEGLLLAGIGVPVGLAAAYVLSGLIASLLFGVRR
jgi:hypothetical protein